MHVCWLVALLATWLASAPAAATQPVAPDVSGIPGGLLMAAGSQTFCQVMIVTANAGVAAASCFEYNADGSVDPLQYSVAVGGGGGLDAAGLQLPVKSVVPHPGYDQRMFANNIAVVTFGNITAENAAYRVGDLPSEWPGFYFVHRSLDANNGAWNDYKVAEGMPADPAACGLASPLFAQNQRDFICNTATLTSMYNSACVLPYKYVVGAGNGQSAQLGLYSHSAVKGITPFCGSSAVHNYYIMLANYIPWINSIIHPALTPYHAANAAVVASSVSYWMNTTGLAARQGTALYSLNNQGQLVRPQESDDNTQSLESPEETHSGGPTKTVYATRTATVVETTTTTEYSDLPSGALSVKATTVTLSGELTITVADGSVCPTVASCDRASSGSDDSSDGYSSSALSNLAATVTVTQAATTVTETVSVTATDDSGSSSNASADGDGHSAVNCAAGSVSQGTKNNGGMTVSEIVAVVIGSVVAGLVLLAGIGFVIFKRWCARQPGEDIDPEEADHLQTGYVSQVGYAPQMGYVQQPPYNPGATENTPSTYTVPALYSSNTAFPRHASA